MAHNLEIVMKLPYRIEGGYFNPRILDINRIHTHYSNHRRLRVFANKGLKCHYCDKHGKYLILAFEKNMRGHLNIYTDELELMTIDHIIPKSKGGKSTLDNLVPCCRKCNTKKSNIDYSKFINAENL